MKVLLSVKILDVEISADLYASRLPKSKKVIFGNLSACACVCEFLALYIPKTSKDGNTKCYTQY